jgi:hypothetical protein
MRGKTCQAGQFFANPSADALVPPVHPLRLIRRQVDAAPDLLSLVLGQLYGGTGHSSIPPGNRCGRCRDSPLSPE